MTIAQRRQAVRDAKRFADEEAGNSIYVPYDMEQDAEKERPKMRRRRTLSECGFRDGSIKQEDI